jgi:prepilin-type N-terminal cleavage/methylation domain-containing protein
MTIKAVGGQSPRGFTLVEILVVIAILAVLLAVMLPAVMAARRAAQITAIKAEIELLNMALVNYRSEYGSLPPCSSGAKATDPGAKHIARLFPRCSSADVIDQLLALSGGDVAVSDTVVTPANALVVWLRGYTNDPASPAIPETERPKRPGESAVRVHRFRGRSLCHRLPHRRG